MLNICPRCGSVRIERKNIGKKTGGTIGTLAGAASGASGTLGGMQLGASLGAVAGPVGVVLGGLGGGLLEVSLVEPSAVRWALRWEKPSIKTFWTIFVAWIVNSTLGRSCSKHGLQPIHQCID